MKSQLLKWRGLTVLFAMIAAFLLYGDNLEIGLGRDYIARVAITGIIEEDYERDKILKSLADDDDVQAVIVYINTPGGTVVGGESIYSVIKDIGKVKPVTAVMGTLATSAGYMVALSTDQIFASQGTLTGSIGVILHTAQVVDLAKKLGIDVEIVKSGPLKASPSPFETFSPEAKKAIQSVINDYHRVFVEMVAENREMPMDKVKKLADGRVYTGKQALDNQLIDKIGGESEAVRWLMENKKVTTDNVKEIDLYKEESGIHELLSSFAGTKSFFPKMLSLQGLSSVWLDGIM